MRKVMIAVALALLGSAAFAEWVSKGDNSMLNLYIDPSSIHKIDDNHRGIKFLYDHKMIQRIAGRAPYLSTVFYMKCNCRQRSAVVLSTNRYSNHLGQGLMVGSDTSIEAKIVPGSAVEIAFNAACNALQPLPNQPAITESGWNQPSASQTQASAGGQKTSSPPIQTQQGGGWDSWLEKTGNQAKVAPQITPSAVQVVGSAPANVETVIKACQHLVNNTGPGGPGIGSIYSIKYLDSVDASTVYGNMGPQVKLVPLKLYAKYRDGENMFANGYLQKDSFGDFKCIKAN